jgi:nitroreductase
MTVTERYADAAATLDAHSDMLALQLAHRSVRRFTSRPVSDGELAAIVAAAQSASTSSNLQSWSVVAVRDAERKSRLGALTGPSNQRFIEQAPLFLVWIADLGRARRLAERFGLPLDGADYLESTLIAFIDAALAAQNAVIGAESLGLGAVFVGGIRNHPLDVAAELSLPKHAVAAFGMAIGTPDPDEEAGIKPRLPQAAVLHHELYDAPAADAHIPMYDERLSDYNARYGMPGNWSDRVVKRLAGPESLSGRHTIRDSLAQLGLPSV